MAETSRGKQPMLGHSTAKGLVHRRAKREKHLAHIQRDSRRRNRGR